jgi:hypothetical protein
MTIMEKVAYIRGLAEGLALDEKQSKESKALLAIIDLLDDIALSVTDLEDFTEELGEHVDQLDKDLSLVEEGVYSDWDDEDDLFDEEDYDDEDEYYHVTCPRCSEVIYLDADMLAEDSMVCPSCGETLEFDFDGEDFDDELFDEEEAEEGET